MVFWLGNFCRSTFLSLLSDGGTSSLQVKEKERGSAQLTAKQLEGIITLGSGLISFFLISNAPGSAKFLSAEERILADKRIKRENVGTKVLIEATKKEVIWRAFRNPNTLAAALGFGLSSCSLQGLAYVLWFTRLADPADFNRTLTASSSLRSYDALDGTGLSTANKHLDPRHRPDIYHSGDPAQNCSCLRVSLALSSPLAIRLNGLAPSRVAFVSGYRLCQPDCTMLIAVQSPSAERYSARTTIGAHIRSSWLTSLPSSASQCFSAPRPPRPMSDTERSSCAPWVSTLRECAVSSFETVLMEMQGTNLAVMGNGAPSLLLCLALR